MMIRSKYAFLQRLTRDLKMKSINIGEELEGATPPSVFIGSWNYPKVYAGPMIAPVQEEVEIFDSPERWIPERNIAAAWFINSLASFIMRPE